MTLEEYMKAQQLSADDLLKELKEIQARDEKQKKEELKKEHEYAIKEAKEVLAEYMITAAKYYDYNFNEKAAQASAAAVIDEYEKIFNQKTLYRYTDASKYIDDIFRRTRTW